MNKDIKKRLLEIAFVSIFLIVVTSFVYLPNHKNLLSALAFLDGQQSFYMEDISSGILLKSAVPTKDSDGLKNDPYTFRVVNNSNKNITYEIVFKSNSEKAKERGKEVLPNHYLKYSVSNSDDTNLEAKTLPDDGILLTTTIPPHTNQVFNFRMWLDFDADDGAMDKIFIGTLEVNEIK